MYDFQGKIALKDNSAIVNLTSAAAQCGALYNAHYSASNALLSFIRSMARELGPKTGVNSAAHGVITTPMTTDPIACLGAESVEQTPTEAPARSERNCVRDRIPLQQRRNLHCGRNHQCERRCLHRWLIFRHTLNNIWS